MGNRYGYQSEGDKPSVSVGWWFVLLSVAILWFWKSLAILWLWTNIAQSLKRKFLSSTDRKSWYLTHSRRGALINKDGFVALSNQVSHVMICSDWPKHLAGI